MFQYQIPESFDVYVPKADRTITVSLDGASPEVIAHLIAHALKQKLGDATAGTKSREEASEAVDSRLETLLTVPGTTGRGPRKDPLDAAICQVIAGILRSAKWKVEEARKATTTVAGAREALRAVIAGALKAKLGREATPQEVGEAAERNFQGVIVPKAEAIVREQQGVAIEV